MGDDGFQLAVGAARAYQGHFVPALFAEWAPRLVDFAGVAPGDRVLDVACGTGVVASAAARRAGADGRVAGVDLNPAMLEVARGLDVDVEWREGDAAALPFGDHDFDIALCQAALMFFPDRAAALREMGRVVETSGRVAVHVWGRLERSEGYARFAEVIGRHAGAEAVELFAGYWVCGDVEMLAGLVADAGLELVELRSEQGAARFPSLERFVAAEVEATPLLERIDADTYARIRDDAGSALAEYVAQDGSVAVPIEAHLVLARPA